MSQLTQDGQEFADWYSESAKKIRVQIIRHLADKADLTTEYNVVPDAYFNSLSIREYSITVQGLKKIAILNSIDQFPRIMQDRRDGAYNSGEDE